MNRKLPIVLLALAALASNAAEPLLLQWGTINTDAPAAQAEFAAVKTKLAKKAAAIRRTAAAETRAAYLPVPDGPRRPDAPLPVDSLVVHELPDAAEPRVAARAG